MRGEEENMVHSMEEKKRAPVSFSATDTSDMIAVLSSRFIRPIAAPFCAGVICSSTTIRSPGVIAARPSAMSSAPVIHTVGVTFTVHTSNTDIKY